MKKSMSLKQLMYSTALFIIASNILTRNLYAYTKNQSWIAVIAATLVSLVMISIYGRLVKNHPGCSLIEINEAVFGVIGGKAVSALYILFFWSLSVLNTRDLGGFVKAFILPNTPMTLIYTVFVIVCIYAVKKGAEKMTRYGALIVYVYLILLLFISVLLLNKLHPENFLPVFTVPLKNFLLSTHMVTMLPFGEILVFLMMAQFLQNPSGAGKALRSGLLVGASATLLIVVRDIAVMGAYTQVTSNPTFNTIRLIDVGGILTRLEIINAVFQMILLFFKTSVLIYATVTGIGKLFNIQPHTIFSLVVAVLVIICANSFFQSSFEHTQWFYASATYATFFLLVLPLLTLIISVIRKKAQQESVTVTQAEQQST